MITQLGPTQELSPKLNTILIFPLYDKRWVMDGYVYDFKGPYAVYERDYRGEWQDGKIIE